MRPLVAFAAALGCFWFAASLDAWTQDPPSAKSEPEPNSAQAPVPESESVRSVSVLTILKNKAVLDEFKAKGMEVAAEQAGQIKALDQFIEDLKADWKRKDSEAEALPKSRRKKQLESNRKAREETMPHFEGLALDGILNDKQRERVRQIQRQARPSYHLVHDFELRQELQLTKAQVRDLKKIWDEALGAAEKSEGSSKPAGARFDQGQTAKRMVALLDAEQLVKLRNSMGAPFAGLSSLSSKSGD